MRIWADIKQISTGDTTNPWAYLNMMNERLAVGVWTMVYDMPTYLLRGEGLSVGFIQFPTQAIADEWIEENRKYWPEITRIESRHANPCPDCHQLLADGTPVRPEKCGYLAAGLRCLASSQA